MSYANTTTDQSSEPPRKKVKTDYYSRDVNFDDLAKHDADFAAISRTAKQDGWIDFHDPKVVQQLTKSLLKYDFGLSLSLPDDRLCPPIPVRWNYVRWIQDLLDTTSHSYSELYDPEREVLGLDIGVGASCIYSLLACASRPEWRMAGTDIDSHSLEYAKKNITANGLEDRIRLKLITNPKDELIPLDTMHGVEELDFIMTNPPFYSNEQDFLASYNKPTTTTTTTTTTTNSPNPPSPILIGSPNEMICLGGDIGFVTRLLQQSLITRTRVTWYTAMLSHMHSLQQIVALLKKHEIKNFAVTALQPGNRTKRYAVAWSFGDWRPRNDVSRHGELVEGVLSEVRDAGVMQCRENVWSRAAKRQRMFEERGRVAVGGGRVVKEEVEEEVDEDEDEKVALAVKITCKKDEVEVRWLRGEEYAIFESFCAMLQRTLTGKQR